MIMTKEAALTGWTIFLEIQTGTGRMVGNAAAMSERPRKEQVAGCNCSWTGPILRCCFFKQYCGGKCT